MTDKVGATGGGEPIRKGILTEYQVQESVKKKETIDANPTQEAPDDGVTAYTPEQAEALLNKNFYSDMGIDFASVKLDEEGKVIKPSEQREAKETLDVMFPEVQKEAELNNAQRSTNVTDLRREAREKYRNMLEVVLPSIDIEHIKGWFDGTKALPGPSNDKIDTKYAEMQESSKDIAATKEKSFYGDDAVSLEMVKATKQIDDKILKGLVIDSDFTDAQKDKIKEGIDKAHAMSLKDLAKEFGYEFDTNGLKNLDKEGNSTREDVQTQVDALKKLLDSIPDETKLNERIKGVTDNINTKHNDAKADKSLNRAYNLTSIKYGELDEEREFDDTELTQLQESDVGDYVTLQKLVLLKEALVPL